MLARERAEPERHSPKARCHERGADPPGKRCPVPRAALELEGPEPAPCPHCPPLALGPAKPPQRPAGHRARRPQEPSLGAAAGPGSASPGHGAPSSSPPPLSPPWLSKAAASTPAAGRALLPREAPRRPLPQQAEPHAHPPTLVLSRARQEQRMAALAEGSAFMPGQPARGGAGHAGGTWPAPAEPLPPPGLARGSFADAASSPAPTRSISPGNYPAGRLPAATSWAK